MIVAATADEAMQVRKKALAVLSYLLRQQPKNEALRTAWVRAVLPCVVDVEASVADKALREVQATLFDEIVASDRTFFPSKVYAEKQGKEWSDNKLPAVYELLASLNSEASEYMQRAIACLLKSEPKQAQQLTMALEVILGKCCPTDEEQRAIPIAVLDLLEEITGRVLVRGKTKITSTLTTGKMSKQKNHEQKVADVAVNVPMLLTVWTLIMRNEAEVHNAEYFPGNQTPRLKRQETRVLQRMIRILANCHSALSPMEKQQITHTFETQIFLRDVLQCIWRFVHGDKFPNGMNDAKDDESEDEVLDKITGRVKLDEFGNPRYFYDFENLRTTVANTVMSLSFKDDPALLQNEMHVRRAVRHLFILGELALMLDKNRSAFMSRVVAPKRGQKKNKEHHQLASSQFSQPDGPTGSCSRELVMALRDLCEQVNPKNGYEMPAEVRAHAFIVFGKLCLRDEKLAKKSIEMLVSHLTKREEPLQVRNNILILLSDLAVSYTSLVDRFVPIMTDFLSRDHPRFLRQQALMVLSSLLAEDFIKFKGNTTFRLIYMLSEADEGFAAGALAQQQQQQQHITSSTQAQRDAESVAALNGFLGIPQFQMARGSQKFSLLTKPLQRYRIYHFLIKKLDMKTKFLVAQGLCQSYLTAFLEGATGEKPLPLPQSRTDPSYVVLLDVLTLIRSKEMRAAFAVKTVLQQAGLSMNDDEDNDLKDLAAAAGVNGGAANANANGNGGGTGAAPGGNSNNGGSAAPALEGFHQMVRGIICDKLLPLLLHLREHLQKAKSPLMKDLNLCLMEILFEYKDELDGIIFDAQLRCELLHDMKSQKFVGAGFGRRRIGGIVSLEDMVGDGVYEHVLGQAEKLSPDHGRGQEAFFHKFIYHEGVGDPWAGLFGGSSWGNGEGVGGAAGSHGGFTAIMAAPNLEEDIAGNKLGGATSCAGAHSCVSTGVLMNDDLAKAGVVGTKVPISRNPAAQLEYSVFGLTPQPNLVAQKKHISPKFAPAYDANGNAFRPEELAVEEDDAGPSLDDFVIEGQEAGAGEVSAPFDSGIFPPPKNFDPPGGGDADAGDRGGGEEGLMPDDDED
eukprot:g2279.t1